MKKAVLIGALCAFAATSVTPALAGGSWKGKHKSKKRIVLKHVAPGNGKFVFKKAMPAPAVRAHLGNHPHDRKRKKR